MVPTLLRWWNSGQTVGLATIVETRGSAPRQPGASMIVCPDGEALGSISGGCLEGVVYETATEVALKRVPRLERYGVVDNDPMAMELTCGGQVDIFIQPFSLESFPDFSRISEEISAGRSVALATIIEHPNTDYIGKHIIVHPNRIGESTTSALGLSLELESVLYNDAQEMLNRGATSILVYELVRAQGEGIVKIFVESFVAPPRMIVFGAVDYASAVTRIGKFLGYRVTVCDARPVFATNARFPEADEVITCWPHRYLEQEITEGHIDEHTALIVLTHDPKFDTPLLIAALRSSKVGYVGAMGSRRTHNKRIEALRQAGLTEGQISFLSSPVGLNLGAQTPEETAISIAAEMISLRRGGGGERLRNLSGPIHHPAKS